MPTIEDTPKWDFPDVRYLVEDKIGEYNISYQLRAYEEKIGELEKILEDKQAQIDKINQELIDMDNHIKNLQAEKIKTIASIKSSLQKVNNSISQDALQVIKSITKKIILRELQTDDQTIKGIVDNIMSKFVNDESTQVEVSELDFQILETAKFKKPFKLVVNVNLDPGDIIISCQSGGVMLKLDEAIDSVLGR